MNFVSTDIIGTVIVSGLSIVGVVFLVIAASLIYHWHYYGINLFRRVVLITIFLGVAFVLYMAAWGLSIEFI